MIFDDQGIIGLDVSFYQDDDGTPQGINFDIMRDYGVSFVIIKVGQLNYNDPDFKYNWAKAKEAGIPRSAYWFCDDSLSGPEQARKFWSLVKDDPAEGMYFADFEHGSWKGWTQLYNFLVEFQKISGLPSYKIGIYTGYYFWVEFGPRTLAQKQWFSQFPLWIAWYAPHHSYVKVPDTWPECLVWQQGTPDIGPEVGVESQEVDMNKFNGGREKLVYYMGTPPVIEPPDGDDEMQVLFTMDLKPGLTANVRSGPGTVYPVVRTITGPLALELTSTATPGNGYTWYRLTDGNWVAKTSQFTEPVPVAPQEKVLTAILYIYNDGSVVLDENPAQES